MQIEQKKKLEKKKIFIAQFLYKTKIKLVRQLISSILDFKFGGYKLVKTL